MGGETILQTDRLLLRELDEGNAEAFFALAGDPEVVRYLGVAPLASVAEALEVLRARPMAD